MLRHERVMGSSDRQHRLYDDLAYLWPVISPPEEYAAEAGHLRMALRKKLGPGRHHILELGAGGGHNLSHLTRDFQATAVDLSPGMLALSRELNPGVDHHLADMRYVRLGRRFDAVLVHDAINHMATEEDLNAVFQTAACHLRPNGVLLAAPDWVREALPAEASPVRFEWVRHRGPMTVTIEEILSIPDPGDTRMWSTFTYVINENGKQRMEQDIHLNGLFPVETWARLLQGNGFAVETVDLPPNEGGYGGLLFVGVLTPDA